MNNPTGTGSFPNSGTGQSNSLFKPGDNPSKGAFFNPGTSTTGDQKPPSNPFSFGNNLKPTQDSNIIRASF